ncbi:thioesterase family protein [Arthrobacter sp. NPDC080031]|uniref:acyl-CoA thioesterase n=1 Tax=Arthrobacter sp. NPDC080031 TaxID=3155918 RepID=UPI00344D1036
MTLAVIATVSKRVLMIDVDLVQVNFSRFFAWMDEGFNGLLHEVGLPLSGIVADGFATPVVDARCSYLRPVGLDDTFTVHSWIGRTGTSSFEVKHRFSDQNGVFAEGRCTHVWVELKTDQRAMPLPDQIKNALLDVSEGDAGIPLVPAR